MKKKTDENKSEKLFSIKRYIKDNPIKSILFGSLFVLGVGAIGTAIFFSGGLLAIPLAGVAAAAAAGGFATLVGGVSAVGAGVAVSGAAVATGTAMVAGESYRNQKRKVNRDYVEFKTRAANDYGINMTDFTNLRTKAENFNYKQENAEQKYKELCKEMHERFFSDKHKITAYKANDKITNDTKEQDLKFYEKFMARPLHARLTKIRKTLGIKASDPTSTTIIENGLHGNDARKVIVGQMLAEHPTYSQATSGPNGNIQQPKTNPVSSYSPKMR